MHWDKVIASVASPTRLKVEDGLAAAGLRSPAWAHARGDALAIEIGLGGAMSST